MWLSDQASGAVPIQLDPTYWNAQHPGGGGSQCPQEIPHRQQTFPTHLLHSCKMRLPMRRSLVQASTFSHPTFAFLLFCWLRVEMFALLAVVVGSCYGAFILVGPLCGCLVPTLEWLRPPALRSKPTLALGHN